MLSPHIHAALGPAKEHSPAGVPSPSDDPPARMPNPIPVGTCKGGRLCAVHRHRTASRSHAQPGSVSLEISMKLLMADPGMSIYPMRGSANN